MGRLKSIAVNEHAEQCYDGEEERMPCCKDTSEQLKVEEITTVNFDFDASPDLYQLATIYFVLLQDVDFSEIEDSDFQHYSPPLPKIDFQVDQQVFLI